MFLLPAAKATWPFCELPRRSVMFTCVVEQRNDRSIHVSKKRLATSSCYQGGEKGRGTWATSDVSGLAKRHEPLVGHEIIWCLDSSSFVNPIWLPPLVFFRFIVWLVKNIARLDKRKRKRLSTRDRRNAELCRYYSVLYFLASA